MRRALLAVTLVALAGCGGGGGGTKGTATGAGGPPPTARSFGTLGTAAPVCGGARQAVRFQAGPSGVAVRLAGRHGLRAANLEPGAAVTLPVPGAVPFALAVAREPATDVAWGRLGVTQGCELRLAGVRRALLHHDRLPGRIDLGVRCPTPNSVRCDRIGVDAQLPVPVERVAVAIAGRRVALRPLEGPLGTEWQANLTRAGLSRPGPLHVPAVHGRWLGQGAPNVPVEIELREIGGTSAGGSIHVQLGAGFG